MPKITHQISRIFVRTVRIHSPGAAAKAMDGGGQSAIARHVRDQSRGLERTSFATDLHAH